MAISEHNSFRYEITTHDGAMLEEIQLKQAVRTMIKIRC